MEIVLIGLNHRTATVELRERVVFSVEQACAAADQLRSRGISGRDAGAFHLQPQRTVRRAP